ncbi:unnamed protein product [Closterium sp. Yama58-4]|nr:unnamed protein product [Closterium sp. Yama58-4]
MMEGSRESEGGEEVGEGSGVDEGGEHEGGEKRKQQKVRWTRLLQGVVKDIKKKESKLLISSSTLDSPSVPSAFSGSSGGAFSASGFSSSSSHPSTGTALHHRVPVQDHSRPSESQKQQYIDMPLAKSFSSSLPAVGGEADVGSPMHAAAGADTWQAVSGGGGGGGVGMGQGGEGGERGEDEGVEERAGRAGGRAGRVWREGRMRERGGAHKGGGEGGAGAAWVRGMKKAHKKLIGYLGASDSFGGGKEVGEGEEWAWGQEEGDREMGEEGECWAGERLRGSLGERGMKGERWAAEGEEEGEWAEVGGEEQGEGGRAQGGGCGRC